MVASSPATPRKAAAADPDDNIPCKTPSPRSSASQAPPNPRYNEDEPSPRVNPHAAASSHPFKGFGRKFMSKKVARSDDLDDRIHGKTKEATEKAKRLDLGTAQGMHDTVNVRERVRRWHAAGGGVVNGDLVEWPPISPATPTPPAPPAPPVPHKRGLSTATVELDLKSLPLVPPDATIKELRGGWESASDADKQAVRRRARSVERERKMKRRRDREKELKSSVGAQTELDVDVTLDGTLGPGSTRATEAGSGVSKSVVYDEDGIRITPMRVKRRGSGSKRKKKKEKETTTDKAAEVQTDNDVGGGVKVEPETEVEEEGGGVKVEVKAWDYEDGIRIYTNKPKSPAILRSQGSGHTNSVRKSEKSVRIRKEEFEAEMRRERKAAREFESLVKKQEAEEAEEREKKRHEDEERIRKDQEACEKAESANIEGSTVVGDYGSVRKKWDEGDDGIRVRPLKNKGTRRKKGAGGSAEKLSTEREASIAEESVAETEREKEREVEREKQHQLELELERLEKERQRERELEKLESERQRQRHLEKLEKERQRVRELEKLEQVRSRQREIEILEKDKELEKERIEKERQLHIELEKLEKEKKRQRELEKALEKEKEKREKEKIRLREKEREMEQERKRERQRMKEREKELDREREREKEKMREKERQLERERQRDREKDREREKEVERERGLLRAKEKEIGREKERELKRVRDMEIQREIERQRERDMEKEMQRRRNEKRRKREVERQKQQSDSESNSEDTESESESVPIKNHKVTTRPLTPEDPLLEFFRKAAKRGNSPRLHEHTSKRDSTPPLEPAKRWESRKKKEPRSASATPTLETPSPPPIEEKQSPPPSPGPADEEPPASPAVPARPKRVKTKGKNAVPPTSTEKISNKEAKSANALCRPLSAQGDQPLKKKPSSARSTPQPAEQQLASNDAESIIDRTSTAHSDASSSLRSFKEPPIPISPPPVMPLKLAPKKKKSDNGNLIPGISSATTSFFKAVSNLVREELQSTSARVYESSSSSDEESLENSSDQQTEIRTQKAPRPIREENEFSDYSDNPDEVSEKIKKTEMKERGDMIGGEEPVAKSPSPKNNLVLDDIPQLPLPRRSLRGSPSPPRPKSKHHRSRTEGSIKSTPSVADDACSVASSEHTRTISLSSVSTVKPLNITPRPTPALRFDPIPPPGQKINAEKQFTTSQKDVREEIREVYTPSVITRGSLKRKYTKHADLISILSAPKPNKSIRSAARTRSHRTKTNRKVSTLTVVDLMDEISSEEVRYMRELRTLVEDVVPVLFSTVLERADDIVRRTSMNGGNTGNNNYSLRTGFGANPTRPIVDMGISLERLKTMHEKMPRKPEELLAWATDAKKVYEEYLSVWRMGFQDVVVTLASNLDEDANDEASQKQRDEAARKDLELLYSFGVAPTTPSSVSFDGDPSTWAMPPPPPPEPEEDEEKVDVAFLLKRPLVRLKILAKLFKRINILTPSPLALSLSLSFHTLVTMARRKIAEEKARIEDEAAASVDVSKAADIYTLFSRSETSLDPSKRVRARDSFWMKLYHSSGRVIQRNVELILRDPAVKGRPHGGEILICEFGTGIEKWLLFAPVPLAAISSRTGDAAGEIVVMIRGVDQDGQEWRQILVLQSATAAGFEWVQMLGLMPIPPEGPFGGEVRKPTILETVIEESTIASSSRMQTPVLRFPKSGPIIDVFSFMESGPEQELEQEIEQELEQEIEQEVEQEIEQDKLEPRPLFTTPSPQLADPRSENAFGIPGANDFKPAEIIPFSVPPDFAVTPIIPGGYRFEGGHFEVPNIDGINKEPDDGHMLASPLRHSPSLHTLSDSAKYAQSESGRSVSGSSIQRSRKASKTLNLKRRSVVTLDDDSRSPSPPLSPRQLDTPRTLSRARSIHLDDEERIKALSITKSPLGHVPVLSPDRPETPETPTPTKQDIPQSDAPPPVPPHKSPPSSKPRTPVLAPVSDSPVSSVRSGMPRRRTSSPLKHEYDPSSPSCSDDTEVEKEEEEREEDTEGDEDEEEEDEEEEEEDDEDDDNVAVEEIESRKRLAHDENSSGSSSSSSEDEESDDAVSICSEEEDGDYPPPMLSIPRRISKQPSGPIALPRQRPSSTSLASTPTTVTTTTIATIQGIPTLKFRASVFSWAVSQWDKLYPSECRILITPGHIEGLPYISPPSSPNSQGSIKDKLIAGKTSGTALARGPSDTSLESCISIFNLDLTPLTPVRRGTAVDISIRTPKNSKFGGTSLMLRCRSPNECESLYNAINLNRIYPANFQAQSALLSSLAVSEMGTSETSSVDNSNVKRGWGSWGRSKTYRVGTTSSPGSVISSSAGQSESSLSSTFGRFRQKNGMLKNSPLSSVASNSSGSINGDASRGGTPTNGILDGNQIFKIRLYRRESSSKWRDLGNSRISILKPPKTHKHPNATGLEKRIIATNKAGNLVFLDAVLGESSFERVARTGIGVSVLVGEGEENGTGVPGGIGGLGAKSIVYMMQMKCEAEAAHIFSIVGKLRY